MLPSRDHVVVFGFHGVARRIVRQLTSAGQQVIVVESDPTTAEQDAMRRYGAHVLQGFRQSLETLDDAHVATAKAVICATNDDLRNIELALLVRERSTSMRIVVQMANSAVGRALRPVTQPGAVLEVAELAAPSFVEAAVQRTTHDLPLGAETFIVSTFRNEQAGTFRSVWGDLAPIALTPGDGSPTVSCPSRDHALAPGDQVTLLGTADDYRLAGVRPARPTAHTAARPWRRRVREGVAAILSTFDLPLRVAAGVLGALAVVSVLVLMGGYREPNGTRMNLLDAVYFTAETVATVGFGDFNFRDQLPWLRVWAIFITIAGATLIAVATALLTNALVTRSLAQSLGRQRVTGMRGHIVVIGLGSVGSRVALELRSAGHEVAVIDSGEGQRLVPRMRSAGIPVLFGDVTLADTLTGAGVHRAAGVAILTSDDLVNIETGLAVREVVGRPEVPIVLRLFGRNLARVVGESLDAGLPRSIAELSAPWFVGAALGLDVLGTFYVGMTPFMAARMDIHAGSHLDGITMEHLGVRMRVIGIQRAGGDGSIEHPPRRDTRVHAGDTAYLVGHYEELFEVLQRA